MAENDPQAQRAAQARKREAIERKNPFSPENRDKRRQELLNKLRTDRNVAQPKAQERSDEQLGTSPSGGDVHRGAAQPPSEPSDGATPAHRTVKDDETSEWYRRKEELATAERRASEALANAQREKAEAEKTRADAEAAVQRMAAAKDDPVQFLSEAGMTKEEWDHFLANGGKMTPEQKQLKEMAANMQKLQDRADAAEKRAQEQERQARLAAEESHFAPKLQELSFVPQMGGVAAVRQRQALLSQKTGQPVSMWDAAQHLEQDFQAGIERILQVPKIRHSLKLDVNTSDAGQAAQTPRTLSNRVSSESSQADAKPHPLDWAAKRKLYQQRVEQERSLKTGR